MGAMKHFATEFVDAYAETLLCSGTDTYEIDEDGETIILPENEEQAEEMTPLRLDDRFGTESIALEAFAEIERDCYAFIDANLADLAEMGPEWAGHDFALTRNGHGTGFWDRGLGELGDRLTAASKAYGEQSLYIGDDGQLHV